MAQTSWGFDGTINEAQWSEMAGLLGNGYVAADSASCVVTAVPGARSVSVSAGTLYGDGIVTVLDAAETVAMTTPVNGQWYVIALRRTWASNSTALVAIAGATTSTSTPTAPPSTLPTLNADPGVLTDQPIAWGWCNSANTTVVVYDMRLLPMRTQPVSISSDSERLAKFPAPVQGNQVWRNDLGAVQTYFGAYDASTNTGGRNSAGWYVTNRQTGLIPIRPGSVVINTGSASVDALGRVSFSGVNSLKLVNMFSSEYKNYRILLTVTSASASSPVYSRYLNGTSPLNTGYFNAGDRKNRGGYADFISVDNDSQMALFHPDITYNAGQATSVIDVFSPFAVEPTMMHSNTLSTYVGAGITMFRQYSANNTASRDGIDFFMASANITGSLMVYGVNN